MIMKNKLKFFLYGGITLAIMFGFSCQIHDYDDGGISYVGGRDIGKDDMPEVKGPDKRGVCYNNLSEQQVKELMSGDVTWAYNWGITPVNTTGRNPAGIGTKGSLKFMPMIWGKDFNEKGLRTYLDSLGENDKESVKYLLGFNEPNMGGGDGGSSMLPNEVAELWPTLEKIAEDYDLYLVSPAMTYSGATLSNGKVYSTPESWLDEFIDAYCDMNGGRPPRMDYIALHSYMMWPGSVVEGYCDKYAQMYNRKILLTEFCSWWDDEGIENSHYVQVQKMSQKIEAMDQDSNVAGYAWFQADGEYYGRPWNCLFETDKFKPNLSLAGLVYTYLSCYDTEKYFAPEKEIPVVSYITSSNYQKGAQDAYAFGQLTFRENDDSDATEKDVAPLIIKDFGKNYLDLNDAKRFQNYMDYQIITEEEENYQFSVRYKSNADQVVLIAGIQVKLPSTNNSWKTEVLTGIHLAHGKQTIRFEYKSGGSSSLAWIKFEKK